MKRDLLKVLVGIFLLIGASYNQLKACHGLALVNYSYTLTPTGLQVKGSSNSGTCGCGPYWMQVEIACTAAGVTGNPPAGLVSTLQNWTGPGVSYNAFPWYNALLNVNNYTAANGWPDQCQTEPYNTVFIPFSDLCPGQTYYFRACEWLAGSSAAVPRGPWTAMNTFTVPGTFVPLSFSLTASPSVFCDPGSSTLTAANITGGCGLTSVDWQGPSGSLGSASSITVTPSVPTTYTCTVNTPCGSLTKTVTVNVIATMSAAFTPGTPQVCAGGSVNFTHTGTTGPLTHAWSVSPTTGVTITTATAANPNIAFTTAGTYTVTHTVSTSGCSDTKTTVVTVNPRPTASILVTNPTCSVSVGSATVTPSGGAPGYTYNWLPSGGTADNVGNLTPGSSYSVQVTDSKGCVVVASASVSAIPAAANASFNASANQCLTGNAFTFTATGGGVSHSYSFTPTAGAPTNTTVAAASYGPVSFSAAGNYTVTHTATSSGGCVDTQTLTLIVFASPTAIASTLVNPTCGNSNGSIAITGATGGTPAYTFSLSPGGSGTSFTNRAPGTYTITVRDNNNCPFTQTVTLTNVPGPSAIALTGNSSTCGFANGSITVNSVTGGTPTYSFALNNGTYSTSTTIPSLAAGTYSVTVKDANNCTFTNTVSINNITGPTNFVLTTTPTACSGATGTFSVGAVTGGTPTYSNSVNGGPYTTNSNYTGQAAGTYSVTVLDANGCSFMKTVAVTVVAGPSALTLSSNNTTCGLNNGTVTATGVSGGTTPFTYQMDGSGPFITSAIFTGLTAGTHTVIAKDANGCTVTNTITVGSYGTPSTTVTAVKNISCNGGGQWFFYAHNERWNARRLYIYSHTGQYG